MGRTNQSNEIVIKKRFFILALLSKQLFTLTNAVLSASVIFSIVTNELIDAFFIFLIVLLNTALGFIQEFRAEKALEKLKNLETPQCRIKRNGKIIQIATRDIIVGDIVVLSEGDRIPADGKILENSHIEIDEAILTGESIPVEKKMKEDVFSGTLVNKGKGEMEVTAIGMDTRFGQIAKTLERVKPESTPLQKQLKKLNIFITIGILTIITTMILLGIHQKRDFFEIILTAISIGVAAIPESLPAVVTITLALGAIQMARRKAIIRQMTAVETLGTVQVIMTDKTGTLTQNSMKVKHEWLFSKENLSYLIKAATLGNTASLIEETDEKTWKIIGDQTDGALLLWAKEKNTEEEEEGKVLDEHTFSPILKTITTIWQSDKGKTFVFVRGAPEIIIDKSQLSQTEKKEILKRIDKYAHQGLRVIGFGYKEEPTHKGKKRENLESNLHFIGLLGIYDPPRPEAFDAITAAKKAGIQIIMVTGDNPITATAIAKEIGLVNGEAFIITGDELEKMTDKDLGEIILETHIFARTKPEDKLRLVELLQAKGKVVGVTGDGVNDALALKKAEVGIAMGRKGTDVAKEASDIVLENDNFSTLVTAIEEGRTIYHNILKAIMYLLAGNISELFLIFFAILFNFPTPLVATQILWVNLVTDGLPALALASDKKDSSLLHAKPRGANEPLLNTKRIILIFSIGIGIAAILSFIFASLVQQDITFARTFTFNILISSHLLLALFLRGKLFFHLTKFLIITIIITILAQFMINFIPSLQSIFSLGF